MLGVNLHETFMVVCFRYFRENWLQLNQFFSFLVFIRTEMSVLCIYLCELFHFMKGCV